MVGLVVDVEVVVDVNVDVDVVVRGSGSWINRSPSFLSL